MSRYQDPYDSSFFPSQYSPDQHDGRPPGRDGRPRRPPHREPGRPRQDGRPRRPPHRWPEPPGRAPWRPTPEPAPERRLPPYKNISGTYQFGMGPYPREYGQTAYYYSGGMVLQQAPGSSEVRGSYWYDDQTGGGRGGARGTLVGHMQEYRTLRGTYRNEDGTQGSFSLDFEYGRRNCFRGQQFIEGLGFTYGCPVGERGW
jgi:hypothetical protein